MDDDALLRYSRQILLADVDIDGQQRLLDARVAILGVGGLGSPVALYLAAAGVGELVLIDGDRVDTTNLQRQIAHGEASVGQRKVDSAAAAIAHLNGATRVRTIAERVGAGALQALLPAVDLVVDCTDNFAVRQALNVAARATGTPWISAAAIRMEGQVTTFDPRDPASPCYACLYPGITEDGETCSETGVLGPVVGVIGSLQAVEAIKLLTGRGRTLVGRLLFFDARECEWRELRLPRHSACAVCGPNAPAASTPAANASSTGVNTPGGA